MTLLADPPETEATPSAPADPRWLAPVVGALGALASLTVVLGIVALVWSSDELSPGTTSSVVSFAAGVWLGLGGATLQLAGVHVNFLPLLLVLLPLGTAALSLRWLLRRREDSDDGWVGGLLPRSVLLTVALWWIGYAAPSAFAVGLAYSGPALPVPWTLVGPLVGIPLAALALVLAREARSDEWLLGPHLDGSRLPIWARRSAVPALTGVGVLLSLGALIIVVAVALGWDDVLAVTEAVGGGGLAAATLWVVQAAALPNLAIWGVSFTAGPGFSVVDGASVTWGGAETSLMPLVPVLAALPQPQAFPWFVVLSVLVPVVAGGVIGHRAVRTLARLASLGTKLQAAGFAAVLAATIVTVLDLLGGGSLGGYRLSDIGAPAGWLFLCLAGELLVGALLVAAWDAWRLRR